MRDVKGFEGLYKISESGQLFSVRSNKFLAPKTDKDGYLEFCLCVNDIRTYKRAHRIVAEAFIPNSFPEKTQINHKDCCKSNNHYLNLEWVTNQENILHAIENELVVGVRGEINNFAKFSNKDVDAAIDCFIASEDLETASRVSGIETRAITSLVRQHQSARYRLHNRSKWEVAACIYKIQSSRFNPTICLTNNKMYLTYREVDEEFGTRYSSSMLPRICDTDKKYKGNQFISVDKKSIIDRVKTDEDFRKLILDLALSK